MANEAKVAAKGIDIILLFRLLKKSKEEAAWKLAFQTEHENTKQKIVTPWPLKMVRFVSQDHWKLIFQQHLFYQSVIRMLINQKKLQTMTILLKFGEINKAEKGAGDNADKYKATYYQGYVTSFGKIT